MGLLPKLTFIDFFLKNLKNLRVIIRNNLIGIFWGHLNNNSVSWSRIHEIFFSWHSTDNCSTLNTKDSESEIKKICKIYESTQHKSSANLF